MAALLLAVLLAGDVVPPETGPRGTVATWKGATGTYDYCIPRSYNPKAGATLVVMCHGSNFDRTWAFDQFKAGQFRKDDIVVAPDGPTPNGKGGFNFMQDEGDADKVAALIRDLKRRLRINKVYVYGHSQGACFAYFFLGQYPALVDGICAHAGMLWAKTKYPDAAKPLPVAMIHGRTDKYVNFGVAGKTEKHYRNQGFKHVRLRAIDGWGHAPHVDVTEEMLKWCDGVAGRTADDCLALVEEILQSDAPDYGTLA
ncbi:MAG: CE1 family esterase, partial [Planctomycetota bacterium]